MKLGNGTQPRIRSGLWKRRGHWYWVVLCAAVELLVIAPQVRAGPDTANDDSASDVMTIVLPPRLAAGENATLAVLGADGKLQPGVTVVLSSETEATAQVKTDSTGRALFAVPVDARAVLARFADTVLGESEVALVVPPVAKPLQIVSLPPWVAVHSGFVIHGFGFMADAGANKIFFGGQQGLVLASSSLSLVVASGPRAELGPVTMVLQTKDAATSALLELEGVEMASDSASLAPGKDSVLKFRVTGTDEPRAVNVRNLSPEVIHLQHGDLQHLQSSGGAQNIISIAVRGLRDGDFSVDVSLAPVVKPPDIDAARALLEAAYVRGDSGVQRRITTWIAGLGDQQKLTSIAKQMEEAVKHSNDADSAALLRAARNALQGAP